MDFDTFITNNWTAGIPADCTRLLEGELDCLEQNRPAGAWCDSCIEFNRLAVLFDGGRYAKSTENH